MPTKKKLRKVLWQGGKFAPCSNPGLELGFEVHPYPPKYKSHKFLFKKKNPFGEKHILVCIQHFERKVH